MPARIIILVWEHVVAAFYSVISLPNIVISGIMRLSVYIYCVAAPRVGRHDPSMTQYQVHSIRSLCGV